MQRLVRAAVAGGATLLSGGTRERFVVQGAAFRVVRGFALGSERSWLLAERMRD